MRRKIMDINERGVNLTCVKDDLRKSNPYAIYSVWYDRGWHQQLITRYEDFESVIWTLHSIVAKGGWSEWNLTQVMRELKGGK